MKFKNLLYALVSISVLATSLHAQSEEQTPTEQTEAEAAWAEFMDSLSWQTEGIGDLKEWSTIDIPEGYRYLNGEDTAKLMEAYGNVPGAYEGMIAVDNLDWMVLFQFDESGYVKDDEKDDLNADELLETLQAQQVASNEYRAERNLSPMYLDGWAVPPMYNDYTNNLEWGLLLRSGDSGQFVNYKTKLLGRRGLMNATLICDFDKLDTVLPTYQNLLLRHYYKQGESYAEYKQGDKLAEYGLTALIAGGAIYGAAKLGFLSTIMVFFKKFIKIIVVAFGALVIGIKKFFAKMAGREVREEPSDQNPS